MRTTGTTLITALVLGTVVAMSGCGARSAALTSPVDPVLTPNPPTGQPTKADRQCRRHWVDLVQLHGENGNPGGSQQALDERWERIDAQAQAFSEQASSADCGTAYADLRTRWGGLERLQDDLHEVDMPHQLTYLEGDRRHYLRFNDLPDDDRELPGALPAQFAELRAEAPRAQQDLADLFEEAATVVVTDKGAVRSYLARVAQRARESDHVRRCLDLVSSIEDAELDEE